MSRVVIANDLPYTEPQSDPIMALQDVLSFSVDDWSESRAKAWIFGIVVGWFDGDAQDDAAIRDEFRLRFGWTGETIARLEALHAAFEALK